MAETKEKRYVSDNAQLMAEWDWNKNTNVSPNVITEGSHENVWWVCSEHHNYQSKVYHKAGGSGCPFCLGRRVWPGFNDLATTSPKLAAEWNYLKNGKLLPASVSRSSNKKVWWICEKGHEWEATINSRTAGNSCPYCSNQKVLRGYNDLATTNPELIQEWDYDRNGEITPYMVVSGSGKKYWWKCRKGHSWESSITHKKNDHGCPYCANQKLLIGYNDLETINPDLAAEWHREKNESLTPSMVLYGSSKKVWWKCAKGHEWKSSVVNRQQRGCPICSNKQVLIGYNDLATTNPQIASEWNYEKNGTLTPQMFTSGSNKEVWWKCKNGHEWKTQVNARSQGAGCAQCSAHLRTSFPEQAVFYYVKQSYPDAINGFREIFDSHRTTMELDVYIPSIKVAIEYDGLVWHSSSRSYQREKEKYQICKENGIKLIRIKENIEFAADTCDILIHSRYERNYLNFDKTLLKLAEYIGLSLNINISRDRNIINAMYLPNYNQVK